MWHPRWHCWRIPAAWRGPQWPGMGRRHQHAGQSSSDQTQISPCSVEQMPGIKCVCLYTNSAQIVIVRKRELTFASSPRPNTAAAAALTLFLRGPALPAIPVMLQCPCLSPYILGANTPHPHSQQENWEDCTSSCASFKVGKHRQGVWRKLWVKLTPLNLHQVLEARLAPEPGIIWVTGWSHPTDSCTGRAGKRPLIPARTASNHSSGISKGALFRSTALAWMLSTQGSFPATASRQGMFFVGLCRGRRGLCLSPDAQSWPRQGE